MSDPTPKPPVSTLRRRVRFAIDGSDVAGGANTFAGSPAIRGWGRHYELDVECRGVVDQRLGYLVDIKDVDRAVRAVVIPAIARAVASGRGEPAQVLAGTMTSLSVHLGGKLHAARLWLTPFHSLEVRMHDPDTVLIRQQFDFAASHRLHCAHLSDEENQRLFGKCNHPSGHGHNYRVEPCVAARIAPDHLDRFSLADLESVTEQTLIRRFDHKHLNLDTDEFGPGGVNPSVENIAMVFFNLLAPAIKELSPDASLRHVTVWETDRTCSTFPA